MNNPELSIIVPIYNSANRGLAQCIDAILKQNYSDFELILVNDGSTDDSLKICETAKSIDDRVVIINKANQGVSAARNDGIDIARGQYVTFIDSDDVMVPGYLHELMTLAGTSDLVVCGVVQCFSNGSQRLWPVPTGDRMLTRSQDFHELIQSRLIFGPCNKIFQLSLIRKHNIRFPNDIDYGEDRVFCYNYLKFCKTYVGTPATFYNYCIQDEDSLSTKSRPDLFLLEYGQWQMLYALYEKFGALTDENERVLATELFWMVSDAITRLSEHGKYNIREIESIVSIPELDVVKKHSTDIEANKIIKKMILNRRSVGLYVINKIIQVCKR